MSLNESMTHHARGQGCALRLLAGMLALACAGHPAAAQGIRAAYRFGGGRVWSASVELPSYDILGLGASHVPLAVNDSGTVLMRGPAYELVRWVWGRRETLLDGYLWSGEALLNEQGVAVAGGYSEDFTPFITWWPPATASGSQLPWGPILIGQPHYARPAALNDAGQLVLDTEAYDSWLPFPPRNLQILTSIAPVAGGPWSALSEYTYHEDVTLTITHGGNLYQVYGVNNYGDTVGFVREDRGSSSAAAPGVVYTYENEYFAWNRDVVLGFEPLCINDARTILGRTPGPVRGMVIIDAFGERNLGPALSELEENAPHMSKPLDGLEEIVLGWRYWRRMTERDLWGQPTATPAPDFFEGDLLDIIPSTGGWSRLTATCISANGRIAGTGRPPGAATDHAFLLVPQALLPDWNRDGRIDAGDRRLASRRQPWRFWINDDDDAGEESRSPSDDLPGSATPDHASPGVDGLRDMVDFFPILLDLQNVLQAIGDLSQVELVLRHADEAFNLVLSDALPAEAGAVHCERLERGFGAGFASAPGQAGTVKVTRTGARLPDAFAANIAATGGGVLYLEACAATKNPLVLELRHMGVSVLTSTLQMSVSPVADMFRVINLRNCDPKFAGADPGPWPTRAGEPPNLPDAALAALAWPLRTLVHVHGFNWSGHEVVAVHSELFKRFHQAGSHARFVGVTWYGDQGSMDLTGTSFDYNENVINAFVTAGPLAAALAPFAGPFTSLFAHSLGNLAVSSAIADHGLAAAHFFMVNAAAPVESYAGEVADRRLMVHPDWKDEGAPGADYPEHLLAANWSRLFAAGDRRSRLSWKDRFRAVEGRAICLNFHSSGEDILKAGNGDLPGLFSDIGARELVWVYNEMIKGTTTFSATLAGEVHGGWGFNRHYMDWVDPGGAAHPPAGDYVRISPARAAAIDPAGLVAEPFFRPFSAGDADFPAWGDGDWLYGDPAEANAHLPPAPPGDAPPDLVKNHAKILAEAVPAHSAAAGAKPLPNLLLLRNVDLDTVARDPAHWPFRDDPDKRDRWLHGDYLKPALSQVARLYAECIGYINFLP